MHTTAKTSSFMPYFIIYALFRDALPIVKLYIGQTIHPLRRLTQHRTNPSRSVQALGAHGCLLMMPLQVVYCAQDAHTSEAAWMKVVPICGLQLANSHIVSGAPGHNRLFWHINRCHQN